MGAMSTADFEARYRSDPDPWGYTSSDYERRKYAATLEACGVGRFRSALELGSSIGVFSAMLAARCDSLTTIDSAHTAVAAARRRLTHEPHVTTVLGEIPDSLPDGPYDLVVASEILYYLPMTELDRTLAALEPRLDLGGRLVAVHWRPTGPDRPLTALDVHQLLRRQPWLRAVQQGGSDDYLLDVLERT